MAGGVKTDEEFSGTRPVEERHRIDELGLDGWMRDHVEGYAGPLTVLQFKGGQSNPTYRLDTPGRSYVMRRKPFGKLLPSAQPAFIYTHRWRTGDFVIWDNRCTIHRATPYDVFKFKRDLRRTTINEYGPETSSTAALQPL